MGKPWKIETVREGGNQRNVKRDLKSGIVTTEIIDDFGKKIDQEHGLITGSVAENGGQYILMTRFPHVAVLIGRKKLEEETGPLGLRPMQKCGVI